MKISCKFSEFDYKRRTEELASEPQSTFPAPLFQTHTGKETQTRRRKHTKVLNNVSLPKSKILCEKKSPLRWWKNQNNFQGIISICSEAVIMSFPIFRSGFPCIGLNLQPNFISHLFHSLSFFAGQYVHCMRRWVYPAI